jgi:hypothetical protein
MELSFIPDVPLNYLDLCPWPGKISHAEVPRCGMPLGIPLTTTSIN